jgi:hypothetical protein
MAVDVEWIDGLIDLFIIHLSCILHPGLPGVLRHSVKVRTLPQDTSVIERVENKSYSDLVGMMASPTQCTMYSNRRVFDMKCCGLARE